MSHDIAPHDVSVNIPLPHSPSSSVSSADDAINVPKARVFFGAMQSPEKKIVSRNARRKTLRTPPVKSPTRRSARLSLAPAPVFAQLQSEDEEDAVREALGEEDGESSTESAGDKDGIFQDDMEPPSALAVKISRAHDNPSPPPQMQDLTAEEDIDTRHNFPRLIDISIEDDSDSPMAGAPSGVPSAPPDFFVSPFSPPPVTAEVHRPPLSAMMVETEDLITFDTTPTEIHAPLVAGQPSEVARDPQTQGLKGVQTSNLSEILTPATSSQPPILGSPGESEMVAGPSVSDEANALLHGTVAEP
ncbi:hypothetical protein OF83DRAFT_879782 [Amylostereum chailletii]|nr:hypothetical protein OF83DRAFT_879782 [Amylostereum chailletii]